MKKLLIMMLFITVSAGAMAQAGDAVIGKWATANGEDHVYIYKKGSKYFGKLGWIKFPDENGKPKVDKNNPDASLRTRPVLNLELLKDFTFDGDKYVDGTIYDPKSGKTYSCKMTIDGNTLRVRGYVGISLLGRTEVWTKVK